MTPVSANAAEHAATTKATGVAVAGVIIAQVGDFITWLQGHQSEIGSLTTAIGFVTACLGALLLIPRLIRAGYNTFNYVRCLIRTGRLPKKDDE